MSRNNEELSAEHYIQIAPSRKSRVEAFMSDSMTVNELELAVEHARSFYEKDVPVARTIVLIPVAAHQEAPQISKALTEYASQVTNESFTVLLYLNCPRGFLDSEQVHKTLDAVDEAKAEHPLLDVRISIEEYTEPRIGAIRRDLWNAALVLAHYEGLFDNPEEDVLGINHDIDIEYMSPRYIQRIQKKYIHQQKKFIDIGAPELDLSPRSTLVRHALPPNHPYIARVISWSDFSLNQIRDVGGFEASLVIPFGWYVKSGGFNAKDKTYESGSVTNGTEVACIPGTILKTSPRRYLDRIAEHGLLNIWTDESFTATDSCREPQQVPDITQDQLEEIIFDSLDSYMQSYYIDPVIQRSLQSTLLLSAIEELFNNDEAKPELLEQLKADLEIRLTKSIKLATRALRGIVESDTLADTVEFAYNPIQLAQLHAPLSIKLEEPSLNNYAAANN